MKALSTLAAVTIILPLGLSAGDMQDRASAFQQLDKDHDGSISVIEATGQIQLLREWGKVDKNSDGVLEQAEFSAFEESNPAMTFQPVDPENPEIGAGPTR